MGWEWIVRGLGLVCLLALSPRAVNAEPPQFELRPVSEAQGRGSISFALTITPPCIGAQPPPLAVAFVLHGVAEEAATRNALLSAITVLTARDRIALLDTDAGVPPLLPLSQAGFTSGLPAALRMERSQALPLLFAGIASASAELSHAPHHLQHIVVLESFADGHPDPLQLAALGESLQLQGISVSAFSRSGCNRSPLRALISTSGGFCIESAAELTDRIELLKESCAPPLTVQTAPSSESTLQILDFSDLTVTDPLRISVPLARPTTVLVHASWPHRSAPPRSFGALLVSSGRWNGRINLPAPQPPQLPGPHEQKVEYQYEGYLR